MKGIGLGLVLTVTVGLALWPSAAGAASFTGRVRAVGRPGQVTRPISRARVVAPRAPLSRHRGFRRAVLPPFAIVGPGLVPAPPAVVDSGGPAEGAPREASPPPVQPKMIVVKPGPTRDWCWDKTTWSWVPTCP